MNELECDWIFSSRYKWPKFAQTSLRKYSCSATTLRFSRLVGANFDSLRLRTKNQNTLLELDYVY